jgi:hypothetical protein
MGSIRPSLGGLPEGKSLILEGTSFRLTRAGKLMADDVMAVFV